METLGDAALSASPNNSADYRKATAGPSAPFGAKSAPNSAQDDRVFGRMTEFLCTAAAF